MKKFPKAIGLWGLVFIIGLIFLTSAPVSAADTVKVGVMYSITGTGSAVGKVQLDGINLAIKQINEKGGLKMGGKKVEVEAVIRDDQTKPDVAVRRLRELVNENVKVIVGGTFAHVSTAINEQIRDGRALFMATNGIQEKIFRKENKAPYYISSLGAVDGIGRMCADYVAKTYKPKHVVLFLPDYAYGRGAASGAHKIFGSKYPDIKITEVWSPVGTPDFTSYIIKIKEIKPDVVMMGHWGNDLINVLKQAYELGLRKDTKLFFNSIGICQAVGVPPEGLEGLSMAFWFYHDLHGGKGWMGYFPLIPPFVSETTPHPLVFNSWGFEIRFYYVHIGFADDTWVHEHFNLGNFRFSFSVVSPVRL